ncbi:MAG TPA: TIGR01777 family oxidoreductase [Phycisphaerae bacterium]|nr:TIGR01777 family oxidoreductase [Phycisphaerae bacterium]
MTKRIILAGGSGFLGHALAAHFQKSDYEIIVLTRSPKPVVNGFREVAWDVVSPGDWVSELDGAAAVINLAGRSVNCRYNSRNRKLIMESRVESTRLIGEAISICKQPPPIWLNSSTATIYKHNFGPAWDESGAIGGTPEARDIFSVEVATAWEQTFNEARTPGTRKVALRTAMVLGNGKNSIFPVLQKLVRYGLGGKMCDGRQFVSWIHETDFCRAVEWLMTHDELSGAVNIAAPNPVTNVQMMEEFRHVFHRSFGLPAPTWLMEIGAVFMRTEMELVVKSRRVAPRRLIESGFEFRFPILRQALEDLRK